MILPKPQRRGPKPRRPIGRGRRPSPFRRRGNLGRLRKLADDYMSLYVRHRDGWRCWVCGSTDWRYMQCAHLIGKGAQPTLRYREDNARCLCDRCHKYYTHHQEQWRMFLVQQLGSAHVETLEVQSLVYVGPQDYSMQAFAYRTLLLLRPDAWKVQERLDALDEDALKLGLDMRGGKP